MTIVAEKPTRKSMIVYLAKCTKKSGWIPTHASMGIGTWVLLAEDFAPGDIFRTREGYQAVDIAGVPFCAHLSVEEGVLLLVNPDHPEANGRFNGFDYLRI